MKRLGLLFVAVLLIAHNSNSTIAVKQLCCQDEFSYQVAKRVSKEEFKMKLKTLDDFQLIDVRTPNEYNRGSIAEAVNINFNSARFKVEIGKLDKTKPTLIFCHSGGRSAKALKQLKSMGFVYVLELEGGYSAWD